MKSEKEITARLHRDRWIEMTRQLLRTIISEAEEAEGVVNDVKSQNKSYALKRTGPIHDYPYPKGSGSCKMTLEMLVMGKGLYSPLFVLGHTPEGEKIKLRWYPKPERVGIYPRSNRYAYEGAEWLVGYIEAQDGAADLLAVVPLDKFKIDATQVDAEKSSLDMVIEKAAKRRAGGVYF